MEKFIVVALLELRDTSRSWVFAINFQLYEVTTLSGARHE